MNKLAFGQNPKMILLLLFAGNLFSALDRFVINYGIVHISDDLQLSASSTGLILSIFFLGYAIMQIPGGWMADRFGARIVLIVSVFSFTIFTSLTGLAWSFVSLLVIRFMFGLGEGSFFPAGAKMIAVSIAEEKRSRAMSLFLSALTVAGVISPILAATLLVSIGWRMMFGIIGIFGFTIGLLYLFFLKPRVGSQGPREVDSLTEVPVKGSFIKLFKTPLALSLMVASFAYGFISWGVMSWMPTYLVQERGLNLISMGLLQMIPAIASVAFYIIAGYVLDKVKVGREKWIGVFSGLGLALFVYLMFHAETVTGVIIYQSIIPIFSAALSTIIFSLPLKYLPEAIGGSAVGVVNLGMQVAGFIAPLTIGFVIDAFDGSFNGAVWVIGFIRGRLFYRFYDLEIG
ncbi:MULTISPECIES: MFS transporter [Bacillaceae]|uniref:MFS transporter n=1 Tax=Bacillaceae TaxID=186817 RepID=UPI0006616B91|nr:MULTISPECIES: MFS transporter [Bacillaceae]MCP1097236.1 MFS transporter [Bacillaceae bacterium OS4b]MCF7621933.1 MFS transporter [Peribacillus frigoritolerans]MCP1152601.1 MFS transporter [Peribacillus frigoritolerans]MCT1391117.1 MFS transporter [Peribacillus frigoritolerans]MEA3577760.1 MFS transporter [Peribacillus frigoritolerans]